MKITKVLAAMTVCLLTISATACNTVCEEEAPQASDTIVVESTIQINCDSDDVTINIGTPD